MRDIDLAADMLAPPATGAVPYHDDPESFVKECIIWRPGRKPAQYQLDNMMALVKHRKIAIRAGRRAGKTTTHAWLILWFALTREAAGEDWKVICTAAVFRQLKDYLWHEVERKWSHQIDWGKVGRGPFEEGIEMMREELRLKHGAVTLAISSDPAKIEGAHADQLLYIFDEAKSIEDETFDAAEGSFAGGNDELGVAAYVIASSTPGVPEGRFYDIHRGADGLDDWHPRHVKSSEVVAQGQVREDWIQRRREQFGEDSPWFKNHVLGEFAAESADGVIRMVHLEECHERWRELGLEKGVLTGQWATPQFPMLGLLHAVGVDVAGKGDDRTVYALRYSNVIAALMLRPQRDDTTLITDEVKALIKGVEGSPVAVIDAIGLGESLYNEMRKAGLNVQPFVASEASVRRAREGIMGFKDLRAAAWWHLRECMDPLSGMELAIPDDDQLTADLLAPRWESVNGKIVVEAKKMIRKRIKRSTDSGDAVVHAIWTSATSAAVGSFFAEPVTSETSSRWAVVRPGSAMSTPALPGAPTGRPF